MYRQAVEAQSRPGGQHPYLPFPWAGECNDNDNGNGNGNGNGKVLLTTYSLLQLPEVSTVFHPTQVKQEEAVKQSRVDMGWLTQQAISRALRSLIHQVWQGSGELPSTV